MSTVLRLPRPRQPNARRGFSCGVAVLVALLPLSLSGCLTVDRLLHFGEKPQVYGGTRSHIYPSPEDFNQPISFGPGFEVADPVAKRVVWGIDLPFSLAADTVLLPVTIPHELSQERRS